jgi:hypothetical protein
MPAAVTPSGVRDGDPAALAALCAARGASVLAYCRHVAGDADAGDAAAAAFASFRAAVVATDDPADLNPEAVLISATRRAAASRAPRACLDVCAVVPLLLAARASRTISSADREILEQHLDGCWTCRAPVARFEAAERAYGNPPDPTMDPLIVTQIIAAMAAAAPAREAARPPSSIDGAAPQRPPAARVPPAAAGGGPASEHATTESPTPGVREPLDPAAAQAAAGNRTAARVRRAAPKGFVASLLGSLGPRSSEHARRAPRVDDAASDPRASGKSGRPRVRPAARASHGGDITRVRRTALAPTSVRASARARAPSRPRLPPAIVLPIAVVLAALLVALFVSGVLGGSDPASSPRVDSPSGAAPPSKPGDVVVPGAKRARPDEVELAKARARASARRKRAAASAREPTTTPAPAPAPAPVTAPPPPAAANPTPPPPPPATTGGARGSDGDTSRKVDPGNGATGAEQIPPAKDTSTVPDLAPPPEPATDP